MVVGFYLFLSGYGLAKKYKKIDITYRGILSRILKLYKECWIVFIPFTIIGYLFYDLRFISIKDFILNITAIKPTMNVFCMVYQIIYTVFINFSYFKKSFR